MTAFEHLQVYDLVLTARAPVFVGSGQQRKKNEYIFNPITNYVQMLDTEAFLKFLVERGLDNDYEQFIMYGGGRLYNFLRDHGVKAGEIKSFCLYETNALDALDKDHSLKEIHTFVRNSASQVYVPGSSVKGALRTVILSSMISQEKKGNWPNAPKKDIKARQMQTLEGEYLNTLDLKKDRNGQRVNDAVNSIMRGISVSDSLPISDRNIILCDKEDERMSGEVKKLPLCRECLRPETTLSFKLTLDRSVLPEYIDNQWLMNVIRQFDDFYFDNYLQKSVQLECMADVLYYDFLILGGGAGFFSKALPYQYLGMETGLEKVSNSMMLQFPKHHHEIDAPKHGISPRTMKYCKYNGQLYPYGLCGVKIV